MSAKKGIIAQAVTSHAGDGISFQKIQLQILYYS